MGQHKLLLPLGKKTVIEHLLDTLHKLTLSGTVVVARPDDSELAALISPTASNSPTSAICLQPEPAPPDMRSSVEYALAWIAEHQSPTANDGFMLLPADHPVLEVNLVQSLIDHWQQTTANILLPTFDNRRGHPTFFRWSLVEQLSRLPADVGLNALVAQNESTTCEVAVNDQAVLIDLDTPADYSQLLELWAEQ